RAGHGPVRLHLRLRGRHAARRTDFPAVRADGLAVRPDAVFHVLESRCLVVEMLVFKNAHGCLYLGTQNTTLFLGLQSITSCLFVWPYTSPYNPTIAY